MQFNYYKNNPDEAYHDDESTEDNPAELVNQLPTKVKDSGIQQQANNQSQEESKTVQSKDSENQQQPAPPPTQPTPHVIQNQFELGIALGALQKENSNLKEYLDNVVAKQKDLHKFFCDVKEMFININNNAGILSETMKHIEPLILKITPEISRAANEIKETLVNALLDKDLIKRVTEHQTEVDAMLKKIKDTTNDDINELYKNVRKYSGTIVDETIEKSKQEVINLSVDAVKSVTEKTDKKYTNLLIFGLLGAFGCSLLTSAFTAKLIATYSSNNTIDYIQRWVNAVAEKSNEHQQQKKSKK